MPFDRIADRKIRDAMASGEFDGIRRDGAIDLDEYFKLPPEIRAAYALLKNAGVVPQELEYLREVDRLQRAYDAATGDERALLGKQLALAKLQLDLSLERARQRR
jgi:hypothetical protein